MKPEASDKDKSLIIKPCGKKRLEGFRFENQNLCHC